MTINVISDLHCGYHTTSKTVIWNTNPVYIQSEDRWIPEENVVEDCDEEAIHALEKLKELMIEKKQDFTLDEKSVQFRHCYKTAKKIKNYDECLNGVNRIIKYLKTDHYKQIDSIFNLYCGIQNYVRQTKHSVCFTSISTSIYRRRDGFRPENLLPADYLIVAGDLGLDSTYESVYQDLKKRTGNKFKDILFIKGNHDYWDLNNRTVYNITNKKPMNLKDQFCERVVDDVVFLGCTMWAPVKVGTWQHHCVCRYMNDYRYIPGYTVDVVNELYKQESNWLRQKVKEYRAQGKKIVVFTHHNPFPELIDDDYKHSDVNAAYAVLDGSCNDIKPDIWICGHSHSYKDIVVNGIRCLRNPIGYREHYGYLPSETASKHWYNTIIEI